MSSREAVRTVEEESELLRRFTSLDYSILVGMLMTCGLIGLYFALQDQNQRKKNKQNVNFEAANYLLGDRKMHMFPVSLSMIATIVSGGTFIGDATEVYLYGIQYVYIIFGMILSAIIMHFIVIPVILEVQVTSIYEYLCLRFDKKLQIFGSIMYMTVSLIIMPIIIYIPALTFNQISGYDINLIAFVIMLVCIFYTCIGGFKAVVWTDVIQLIVFFGTLIVICVKGTMNVGGFEEVYRKNVESTRIEYPDFRIDPTIRHSFWTLFIGGGVFHVAAGGFSQNLNQRCLSVNSVRKARMCNYIFVLGFIVAKLLCCYNGLLIYAKYSDCDPLTTKLARKKDQVLPLFIMDTFKDMPGVTGFFVAGIFAAALSTLSTAYNTFITIFYEDIIKNFSKRVFSENEAFYIMRGLVLMVGSISIGFVFVVPNMGQILQLILSIPTLALGPLLGIFIIGMLIPWIGKKATFFSLIISFFTMLSMVLTMQMKVAQGSIRYDAKDISVEGCSYSFNSSIETSSNQHHAENTDRPISYFYFTLIGTTYMLVLSTFFSLLFGFEDAKKVDPRLLAPFMRRFIESKYRLENNSDDGTNVEVTHKFI